MSKTFGDNSNDKVKVSSIVLPNQEPVVMLLLTGRTGDTTPVNIFSAHFTMDLDRAELLIAELTQVVEELKVKCPL